MWGELSSEWGELSSECGASCLGASFLWGELSWGELSLGRVVRNPIVVYPLKIALSSDKFNVLKRTSIEYRGHLFSETIGISRNFCCFHPLQIKNMMNLI